METKSLSDVIQEAIHNVNTYKHPNLDEFLERINPILKGLGYGGITDGFGEYVVDIQNYRDYLEIETEWSARGCSQQSNYHIPYKIIDAEDPVFEAKKFSIEKEISETNHTLRDSEEKVNVLKEKLSNLQRILDEHTKGKPA